uniref:Integrase catalytic domain-containing protein n=1 Tax=Strongyloides venezuelensis TaxID=75913 RepID=A0A0K0FJM0_STRVS
MYVKKDYSKRLSNVGTEKCYNCRGFRHFANQRLSKKYEHRTQYVDDYDSDVKENNADKYFGEFTIVDNCSCILKSTFCKECQKRFSHDLENSRWFQGTVKFIHSDNGLKFCNKNIINWAKSKGIVRTTTIAHTPEANPVERYNRTLNNTSRIYNDIIQTTSFSALGIKNDVQYLRILSSLIFIIKPTNRDLAYKSDIGSLVDLKDANTLNKSLFNVESDDLPDLPSQKEDIVSLLEKNTTNNKPSHDLNFSDNDSSGNIDDD